LSSALRAFLPDRNIAAQLAPFADTVYLHQVGERKEDGSMRRFPDLGEALATATAPEKREWRIHFHVPLFAGSFGSLVSTRDLIPELMRLLKRHRFTEDLEIETYTWDLLPAALKVDLTDSIEREFRWVMEDACEKPQS